MSQIRREGRDIRRLRTLIPTFTCVQGCSDCCGPIPFSRWEWDRVTDKRKATCLDCPYSTPHGCAIYEERPMMCRLFGAVDDPMLRCPHGCAPEKPLSADEGRRIANEYARLVEQAGQHKSNGNEGKDT